MTTLRYYRCPTCGATAGTISTHTPRCEHKHTAHDAKRPADMVPDTGRLVGDWVDSRVGDS